MKFDVAKQPERFRMVRWDGTNVDEVNAYIASVDDPTGTAEVILSHDGNAVIRGSSGADKPLVSGALVHAESWMWGGPTITIYDPAELAATLYPYPTFDPVVSDTDTSA